MEEIQTFKVGELLKNIIEVQGELANIKVKDVVGETYEVTQGVMYIAREKRTVNNEEYILTHKEVLKNIKTAIEKGALVIVASEKYRDKINFENTVFVQNVVITEASVACTLTKNPSTMVKLVGITGSTQKEETAFMLKQIYEVANINSSLFSKKGVYIGSKLKEINYSDGALEFQKALLEAVKEGSTVVFAEIDAVMLKNNIVLGSVFEAAIFTNISEEEKFRKGFNNIMEYLESKLKLFDYARVGIINNDDFGSEYFKSRSKEIKTYGIANRSDFTALDINPRTVDTNFATRINNKTERITLALPGIKNVYSALAAITFAVMDNVHSEDIKSGLLVARVPGKRELLNTDLKMPIIIDEAKTPEEIDEVLKEFKGLATGRIVTLVGDDGLDFYTEDAETNRKLLLKDEIEKEIEDRKKYRYEIGKVASRHSDLVIVTVQNSKYEDPNNIINEIIKGIDKTKVKYFYYTDRKEALKSASFKIERRDLVLILGLGAQMFVEVKGQNIAINEKQILTEVLEEQRERITSMDAERMDASKKS